MSALLFIQKSRLATAFPKDMSKRKNKMCGRTNFLRSREYTSYRTIITSFKFLMCIHPYG